MVTLSNIQDGYASQSRPSTAFTKDEVMAMRTLTGANAYAYQKLSARLGVPVGATITTAVARYYSTATWAGSNTVTLKRITGLYPSGLKWTNKPAVTATGAVAVTKTGAVAGTEWAFDVLSLVSAAVAAASFGGFRLESDAAVPRRFWTANAETLKPTLEITWTMPPEAPTKLNPSAGQAVSIARPTLQFNHLDASSGGEMIAYQVQLNYTVDTFTAPSVDTGEVASSAPEHPLLADLTPSTPFFWRVRTKGAGGWGPYSAPASSIRTAKGTLTITAPAVAPDDFVSEYTPPKAWTFSGTQTAYQVIDTDSAVTTTVYDDSLRQTSTDNSYTSDVSAVFTDGLGRSVFRVWDDVDRASTPGDDAYVEVVRTYRFEDSDTVAPVTSLAVVLTPYHPAPAITFDRSTMPDSLTVVRSDGRIFANIDPADFLVSGTSYSWPDVTAPPHHALTWTVIAVVNGVSSQGSPTTDSTTITPQYAWLLDELDPTWFLAIADQDEPGWNMGEQSEMFEVINSDRLVLHSQGLRGYEDSFSGGLYSDLPGMGTLTAQDFRDRVWDTKRNPTRIYRFVLSDMNIPVVVRQVKIAHTPSADLEFGVSFEFYQQGELPWTV